MQSTVSDTTHDYLEIPGFSGPDFASNCYIQKTSQSWHINFKAVELTSECYCQQKSQLHIYTEVQIKATALSVTH